MPTNNSIITKAVIPAAGHGTRLRPLTNIIPKVLLPLGTKPTVQHIVEELQAVGVEDIIFVVSPTGGSIREYFDSADCKGKVRISYAVQKTQKGLADAILQAEELVGEDDFIVALGDTVVISPYDDFPVRRLISAYQSNPAFAAILVEKVPISTSPKYGMVKPMGEIAESFEISDVIEKPPVEESPSDYAIGGRYIFRPEIFDWIRRTPPGALGEIQITDAVRLGISAGKRVWCVPTRKDEYRYDIGDFKVYCAAFIKTCMADPHLSAIVEKVAKGES
ncbi:MAG: NTP transferase domain-containing protein [Armatimonadetes bacterium]|nr:NTP transferase domain-containing protein [Armatimonadota bacterium]